MKNSWAKKRPLVTPEKKVKTQKKLSSSFKSKSKSKEKETYPEISSQTLQSEKNLDRGLETIEKIPKFKSNDPQISAQTLKNEEDVDLSKEYKDRDHTQDSITLIDNHVSILMNQPISTKKEAVKDTTQENTNNVQEPLLPNSRSNSSYSTSTSYDFGIDSIIRRKQKLEFPESFDSHRASSPNIHHSLSSTSSSKAGHIEINQNHNRNQKTFSGALVSRALVRNGCPNNSSKMFYFYDPTDNISLALVRMHKDDVVTFHGAAYFQVVSGALDVLGARIGAFYKIGSKAAGSMLSDKNIGNFRQKFYIPVFSSPLANFVVSITAAGTDVLNLDTISEFGSLFPESTDEGRLLELYWNKYDSLRHDNFVYYFLKTMDSRSDVADLERKEYSSRIYTKIVDGCLFQKDISLPNSYQLFQYWDKWGLVNTNLLTNWHERKSIRLLITGEKSTGKSMMARCITNAFLSSSADVLFLDTDLGQPELGPMGLVSLFLLNGKSMNTSVSVGSSNYHPFLLGPSASHCFEHQPLRSFFLGGVSPRNDFKKYIEAIQQLIVDALEFQRKQVQSNSSEFITPLVINGQGWVSGLGLEFLKIIWSTVDPSHSVVMEGKDKHIPGLEFLEDNRFSKVYRIQIPEHDNQESLIMRKAHTQRDISLSRYFGIKSCLTKCGIENIGLSQCPIYEISLDDFPFIFLDNYVVRELIPLAINASVVAMIEGNENQLRQDDIRHNDLIVDDYMKRYDEKFSNCIGLGLVRNLDFENRIAYIATPVPPHLLEKVGAFVQSRDIQLSSGILINMHSKREAMGDTSPYVVYEAVGIGNKAVANTRLLMRNTKR